MNRISTNSSDSHLNPPLITRPFNFQDTPRRYKNKLRLNLCRMRKLDFCITLIQF